jgi:hypothetical protein
MMLSTSSLKKQIPSSLLLLGTAFLALHAEAEILGLGTTYHGYNSDTRWGCKVLHNGPYHIFVSDNAAGFLEEHRGKPLQVKVSKLLQPINPGAGLIDGIKDISIAASDYQGLFFSIQLDSHKVERRRGVTITSTLRNDSTKSITVPLDTLAFVYVTDSPKREQDLNYHTPSNMAYWYYRYGYRDLGAPRSAMRIACHETRLESLGTPLGFRGEGFSGYRPGQALGSRATIKPGGWIEFKYVVAKELLPDDYEVFLYLRTGNLSSIPGPMSKRLSLDIAEQKQDVTGEQDGADQPATAPESKPEGNDKSKPESKPASR